MQSSTPKAYLDLTLALDYMPIHRSRSKRASSITLDVLLEEGRSISGISANSLDLILMGYRYTHLFLRELRNFQPKKLNPEGLQDLWQIAFAALISRDKSSPATLVNEAVEVARKNFGERVSGITNAFLRNTLRNKEVLIAELKNRPEVLLGPQLQDRWAAIPKISQRMSLAIAARPAGGINAVDENAQLVVLEASDLESKSNFKQWIQVHGTIYNGSSSEFPLSGL